MKSRRKQYRYNEVQKRRILEKYLECRGKEGGIEEAFKWFKRAYPDAPRRVRFSAFKQECYRLARKAEKDKRASGRVSKKKHHIMVRRRRSSRAETIPPGGLLGIGPCQTGAVASFVDVESAQGSSVINNPGPLVGAGAKQITGVPPATLSPFDVTILLDGAEIRVDSRKHKVVIEGHRVIVEC